MNKLVNILGLIIMLFGQIYLTRLGVNFSDRLIVLMSFGIGTLMVTEGMK